MRARVLLLLLAVAHCHQLTPSVRPFGRVAPVRVRLSPLAIASDAESTAFEARREAAVASGLDEDATSLGSVVRREGELVVLEPPVGCEPADGSLVAFADGGVGAVLFCRVGLAFATQLSGPAAVLGEAASRGAGNLTLPLPAPDEAWAGEMSVRSLLATAGRGGGGGAVFEERVPQARRVPIGKPLHTGVTAVDALAPIGRGQSMLLLAPETLPSASGSAALASRMLSGAAQFAPEVKRVVVTTAEGAEAAQRSEWGDGSRLLVAESDAELVVAAQAACSMAQRAGGDALVVVDDLAPLLRLWRAAVRVGEELGRVVRPEEEGSMLRGFYSCLTERAHRRLGGESVTLLLLQPSPSVRASGAAALDAFALGDFEAAGFSQRALGRLRALEAKGIALTPPVLEKLGIPAPGSGHPRADGGRAAGAHVEELTSLVDGHIELSEPLAAAGRSPPIDPTQSLTRIGVGSTKLRPTASSAAMRAVTRALRLELASAADPVACEPAQRIRADACISVLQQPDTTPVSLGEQVALLSAATDGLLDEAVHTRDAAATDQLLRDLLAAVSAAAPELLPKVSRSGELTEAQAAELRGHTREFLAREEGQTG
uniref:ATPase F1/V1/A1 complex alpha/beta subunit nucleotide-binding domain-containing protein n=1 Tax=Emiliania huxleyi TaxID=2903 RepID=A0A7S3WP47_EMIHU